VYRHSSKSKIVTCVVVYTYKHFHGVQIKVLRKFVIVPNRLIILLFVAIYFLTVTFNSLSVNYHILSHSQHITSGPHNALKDRICVGG